MTLWQRWRFRARLRAIRADLDRLAQRLDHIEQQIELNTKALVNLNQLIKHPTEKRNH